MKLEDLQKIIGRNSLKEREDLKEGEVLEERKDLEEEEDLDKEVKSSHNPTPPSTKTPSFLI